MAPVGKDKDLFVVANQLALNRRNPTTVRHVIETVRDQHVKETKQWHGALRIEKKKKWHGALNSSWPNYHCPTHVAPSDVFQSLQPIYAPRTYHSGMTKQSSPGHVVESNWVEILSNITLDSHLN